MLKSSRSAKVLLPVVVLAAVALSACSLSTKPATPSPSPVTQDQAMVPPTNGAAQPARTPSTDESSALTTSDSAQGTVYTQTLFYMNPAGGDNVGFTLTVDDSGTIVNADAEIKAINQTSVGLQTNFKSELKQAVVGKKVAGLQVDRIGGASLTTGAFKQFLTEVEGKS